MTTEHSHSRSARRGYEVDVEEEENTLYPTRTRSSVVHYRPLDTREGGPGSQALVTRGRQDLARYDPDEVNVFVRRRRRSASAQQIEQPRLTTPHVHASVPYQGELERQEEGASRPETEPLAARAERSHRRQQWLTVLSLGMLVMLGLWIGGSWLLSWWHLHQDDATYGRPRTYQCDAVVGHHDSAAHKSHFIALNLNRHVEIIELPGGDASAMKVYVGPVLLGDGQDLTPVTLSFRDVTGDGQPDMLVTLVGQDTTIVFVNDHGQFRPQHPGEQVHL